MTNVFQEIAADAKALAQKLEAALEPAEQTVKTDAEAIASTAWNYIKANGLTDLYNIALSVVAGAVSGALWGTTLATVVSQAETAGIQIAKGSEALVAAQAQADLIAAGKLLLPITAA